MIGRLIDNLFSFVIVAVCFWMLGIYAAMQYGPNNCPDDAYPESTP